MYGLKLSYIIAYMILGIILWSFLGIHLSNKKIWKYLNVMLMLIGLYGILKYTVLGRHSSSERHQFIYWMDDRSGEFWREMLMNVFLYFPFGVAAANVLHSYKRSVIVAFILSVTIESWQYLAGTGVAQMTDVICNVGGVIIGGLVYLSILEMSKKEHLFKNSNSKQGEEQ